MHDSCGSSTKILSSNPTNINKNKKQQDQFMIFIHICRMKINIPAVTPQPLEAPHTHRDSYQHKSEATSIK